MIKKGRVFSIIQIGMRDDLPSRMFDYFIITVIMLNLFLTIFETFPESKPYDDICFWLEAISVGIFTVEYLLRIWTADLLYPMYTKGRAKLRYIFSFFGVIDFLSFFPFFMPFFFPKGIIVFRMFRVARILRMFQINRYSDSLTVIANVLSRKKGQLLSSIYLILVLMISASLCMYSVESRAQPEVFENAFSGFWWAVSTMLTIGYGDIYPVTVMGKIIGTFLAFLGVGMIAVPTGILTAAFVEQFSDDRKSKEETAYCPYCGKELPK